MYNTKRRDPLVSVTLRTLQWSEILACMVAADRRKLTESERATILGFMFEVGEQAFEDILCRQK